MVISLAELSAKTYLKNKVVSPLNCRIGLFHIHGKDNLDSNVTSRIASEHFHGTSMSVFQFPTQGKKFIQVLKPNFLSDTC